MRQILIQSAFPPADDAAMSAYQMADAAAIAADRLLDHLEVLVGIQGADALYSRSVHITRQQYPSLVLSAKEPRADQLALLRLDIERMDASTARTAAISLINNFADLLVSLIGEPLTNRLLRSAWNIPPVSDEPIEEKTK